MGISVPIIVYTHTDMKDIWPMFFGQFKKYISNTKIYVAVNQNNNSIPSDYIQIVYDDTKQYTDRWKHILTNVKEDIILFLHEDMILFDKPDFSLIKKYYNIVLDGKAESIKLIFAGDKFINSPIDNTLVINEYAKISIQPTIINKNVFLDVLNSVEPTSIWNFEQNVQFRENNFMVRIGNEKKRGIYHYDSLVFPYTATAINKGKWNYNEYQKELDQLFTEYEINPFERGIS